MCVPSKSSFPHSLPQLTLIELELMQAIDAHELAVYIWEPNSPGMVGEKEGEKERGRRRVNEGKRECKERRV